MGRRTLAAVAIGVLWGLSGVGARADGTAAPASGEQRMRVYIDPETGRFGAPPPGESAGQPPAALQGLAAEHELVERVNPAGGYSIDLERRFGGVARVVSVPGGIEAECEAGERPAAE